MLDYVPKVPHGLHPRFVAFRPGLTFASLALVLVLMGAVVFGLLGNGSVLSGVDNSWYQLMLRSRTPAWTEFNRVLDFVGNDGMYIYGAALFLLLLRRHPRLALFTAGANIGTFALTQLIKVIVDRDRPLDRLVRVDSGSYPSGHTSATFAAMLATALIIGRLWMWVSGTILGVLMMYSRTYLGAHWLSDTVAGALLGVGFVLLLWTLMEAYIRRDKYLPSGRL